jgi:hypothetical protein
LEKERIEFISIILKLNKQDLKSFLMNQINILQIVFDEFIKAYSRESLKEILILVRFFSDLLENSGSGEGGKVLGKKAL